MTRPSTPPTATAGCEVYRILRSLTSQGAIIGRELAKAKDALIGLGLEEIEKPLGEHDELLLQESRNNDHQGAFLCLRCRVSWPLEQKVRALHRQFAKNYGVELLELAAFALDDVGTPFRYHCHPEAAPSRRLEPFTLEVIRSYEPELSSLSHWARQKLDGRNDLKAYLLQQGVVLMRDWALLGDSSHKQVEEAVGFLEGSLSPDDAVALHRRYLPVYRRAKLLYRQRTGRQRGWEPDAVFLNEVAPDRPPGEVRQGLEQIAEALRRVRSGQWQKAESDLWDGCASEEWTEAAEWQNWAEPDTVQSLDDVDVPAVVEAVGMGYAEKMVADLDGDELGLAIWQAWANGLPQRQIAGHCGTNQSRVSRMLQEKVRAGEIATLAMVRIKQSLGRQSDASWVGIFRSLPRQQEAEARLMNHLLQPEQEEGISPMRRWVKQSLASLDHATGCGDGLRNGGRR